MLKIELKNYNRDGFSYIQAQAQQAYNQMI